MADVEENGSGLMDAGGALLDDDKLGCEEAKLECGMPDMRSNALL